MGLQEPASKSVSVLDGLKQLLNFYLNGTY